ncbi:MAG: DNA cytosine methyltransferase [Candidatus Omnitrophica bacterium]|nr:DNA cytosine methyltransferase [Candidatus Omnitrophota bacterium]
MPRLNGYMYIDLFAGCGGASLGLLKAGWKGLFAIEKSKMAFSTLQYNLIDGKQHFEWPGWLPQKPHNINTFLRNYKKELIGLKGKVTLLVGGPPCQGFSFAGRRNEADKRNKLVNSYIRFVRLVKPRIIFFENVKGFTIKFKKNNSSGRVYSDYVLRRLEKLGYNVHADIINFGDFGVPQERKRFILVGVLGGDPMIFFKELVSKKIEFLKKKGIGEKMTLKDAISDLERRHGEIVSSEFPGFKEGLYGEWENNYQKLLRGENTGVPDSHRFPNHNEETVKKFSYILSKCSRGKNIDTSARQVFSINKHHVVPLAPDRQSPTLTTLPDDYIHYAEPRVLSVREYARVQSFDDWYKIREAYTTGGKLRRTAVPRYSQVGNAIPPLFMEHAGEILKEMVK